MADDMELTNDPHSELPLSDRRDLELGRFIHQFAMLEDSVAIVTWATMGVGPPDGAHVPLPGLAGTLQLLRGLAKVRFRADFARRVETWADEVQKVGVRRNALVHQPWISETRQGKGTPEDELGLSKMNLKSKKNRISTTSLSELRSLRNRATELVQEGGGDLFFEILAAQGL